MPHRYTNVIVFGATGDVGRACAIEASKRGAKVWLGMRDPSKSIEGIPDSDDTKFPRVKADISDAASITAAIETSGAKAAFTYTAVGSSPTGVGPAVKAMKAAGVEYVVLLSSVTVPDDKPLRSIPSEDFIPFVHAQAEIALEDAGIAHTALRPASFATNPFRISMETKTTPYEINVFEQGTRKVDNIVPLDIGRVAGATLVDRPNEEEKEIIYLFGPNISTEFETAEVIRKTYAKDVKVVKMSEEEWAQWRRNRGVPEPMVKYFLRALKENDFLFGGNKVNSAVGNVKKYSGYEPTTLEEFVKAQN